MNYKIFTTSFFWRAGSRKLGCLKIVYHLYFYLKVNSCLISLIMFSLWFFLFLVSDLFLIAFVSSLIEKEESPRGDIENPCLGSPQINKGLRDEVCIVVSINENLFVLFLLLSSCSFKHLFVMIGFYITFLRPKDAFNHGVFFLALGSGYEEKDQTRNRVEKQ